MNTILVVEDEPNQRLLYRMELENEGHRVVLASQGEEALEKVKEAKPDLVVLDMRIPVMDGMDFLDRMMGMNTKLPVIIYSAYDGTKDNFGSLSADAYLVKSSNLDLLKEEIKRILSQRKSEGRWPVWGENNKKSAI